MRLAWLLLCLSFAGAAHAEEVADALSPVVTEIRLGERAIETIVWRDVSGGVYVETETLRSLGVAAPSTAASPTPLSAIPDLHFVWDNARAALLLSCARACRSERRLGADTSAAPTLTESSNGAFLNLDLAATMTDMARDAGGLFELGLFGAGGLGLASWAADTRRGFVRLETAWASDDPRSRRSLRIGDSISRSAAGGAPLRFGGIQWGTNFALDPGFVTFPAPTLRGEAVAPSVVDLYVDGALRMRQRVESGPFAIVDAPVLTGSGVAEIVVTDALGREHASAYSFQTNALMLRPRLADYSISVGAEREYFAEQSASYGRAFGTGMFRYGFSEWLTGEARLDVADDFFGAGIGASTATPWLGQVDVALAASNGERDGSLVRISALRELGPFAIFAEAQSASTHYKRLGERDITPARLQAVAGVSADFSRFGAAAINFVVRDERARDDVATYSLSYAPPPTRWGRFDLNVLQVEQDDAYTNVSLRFSTAIGRASFSSFAESARDGLSGGVSAQRASDPSGGFGWRARASGGAFRRADLALTHLGAAHEASLEASVRPESEGLRAQYASGIAWIGGGFYAARPIRESFALVDAGAPDIRVLRDRRVVARTDLRGRTLITDLRPFQANPIALAVEDVPLDQPLQDAEQMVSPARRSGVIVRFQQDIGTAGEARVVDESGSPLPEGTMLVRHGDGMRFPVGALGRVYLTGIAGPVQFDAGSCNVAVAAQDLNSDVVLACRAG